MMLPEWKGGTLFYIVIILWLTKDSYSEDVGCNTEFCWQLYEQATIHYQADKPGISNPQVRHCAVLRTYKQCLVGYRQTGDCDTSLAFRSSLEAVKAEFRNTECEEEGPVYPEGPGPELSDEVPCQFNGRPIYSYCSLFGDPHLVTFEGEQSTCKIEGAWPLVDNKFITVQVTNAPLAASTKSATVTQKVTVVIKGMASTPSTGFCGSGDAVFYHAEIGSLPNAFSDGLREYGNYKSIQVNTITPGEQVEIYVRYIDTTVIIRQIDGQYLSIGLRMPEEVLNGTRDNPDDVILRQLCFDGCPASEKVDIGDYLSAVYLSGTEDQKQAYTSAQASCRDIGVTDYFFDSCVFDLLMTGEPLFSSMAVSAYEDVKKYASRQPRWTDRQSLNHYIISGIKDNTDAADGGSPSAANSNILSSSNTLIRTLLFVYIMHVVSFLCLNR